MKVRVSGYQDVSANLEKPVMGTLSTFRRNYVLICDHKVSWENLFGSICNLFIFELKESMMKRDNTTLNGSQFVENC